MKIAVGMDLHKKSAVCYAVYAGDGEANEKNEEFLDDFNRDYRMNGSQPQDITKIAKALSKHESHFLIENSTKTFEVYWILTNLGCHVTVAQAEDLFRITRSVKKTDRNDSMELAFYMRRRLHGENEFSECVMPSKDWMMKREICRVIFNEKLHLADVKRRCRMHMLLHGITLSREYSDIFVKKAIDEMASTKDPCLLMFINEAMSIKRRTNEEAKLIVHLFEGNRMYELIRSIPGFGSVTSAYLSSMIMDIDRFRTCNKFTANFGIVPKINESSDVSHNCHTTHRGDDEIRRLLRQAAFVHVSNVQDSVVTKMYKRLKARGMAHREVEIACARKLLCVVWSVLKNDRPYTDDAGLLARASEMKESLEEEQDN